MNFEEFYIEPLYYDYGGVMQPPVPMPMQPPTMPPGRPSRPNQPPMPIQPDEPPVVSDTNFIQGYLRTIIGRYVKVEFILGSNMLIDREGTLLSVGVDHIVLREPETDDNIVADLYSIKFVKVYY